MPSPEAPLAGSCACGTVRFQVTAAFKTAGYCHCTRCQRRAGTLWTMNGMVHDDGFELLAGAGFAAHLAAAGRAAEVVLRGCAAGTSSPANPGPGGIVGVRFGALHGDPGIEPRWRQWIESAPDWAPIPDDGLPRFPARARSTDIRSNPIGYRALQCTSNWRGTSAGRSSGSAWSRCGGCSTSASGPPARGRTPSSGCRRAASRSTRAAGCCSGCRRRDRVRDLRRRLEGYGWLTDTFTGDARWVIVPMLLVAGVLIGFGAKTAGGCTSGNGLSGNAILSPAEPRRHRARSSARRSPSAS